jgi:hypothetical protein
MDIYIVTVRHTPASDHNPAAKQTGVCPHSLECTDVTGAHHSFLVTAPTAEDARAIIAAEDIHVTRVERT